MTCFPFFVHSDKKCYNVDEIGSLDTLLTVISPAGTQDGNRNRYISLEFASNTENDFTCLFTVVFIHNKQLTMETKNISLEFASVDPPRSNEYRKRFCVLIHNTQQYLHLLF